MSLRQIVSVSLMIVGVMVLSLGAQPSSSLEYSGFSHEAFGNALLEEINGSLEISNIGKGGFDGVSIDLEAVSSFEIEWSDFSLTSANDTTSLQISSRGTRSGDSASGIINFLLMQAFDSERGGFSGLEIAPDFMETGTERYRFEVYNDGILLESQVSAVGSIIARTPSGRAAIWPTRVKALGGDGGSIGFEASWSNPLEQVIFVFLFRDNLAVAGDELRLYVEDTVTPLDQLTEFSMWIGDIPSLTITHEEAAQ